MNSILEGVFRRTGRGRGPQSGPGSFLFLYETAIVALAATLSIGMAASGDERLGGSAPFLLTVLGLWGLFVLIGTVSFPRGGTWTSVRLTGDLTFCLFLVTWTGGVESFLHPILLASIAVASTFLGRRRAVIVASAVAVILLIVTVGQVNGWTVHELLGGDGRTSTPGWSLAVRFLATIAAAYAVALLASRLGVGLRHAERINDLIVQAIGEGIIIIDQRGIIRHANFEARRILGFPQRQDWRGQTARDVLRRSEDGMLRNELENPRIGERLVHCRSGRKGQHFPLRLRTTVAETAPNGPGTWIFLMRDLTLERRMARAEARLQHLEELEDLALGLAHEIRNPLASLRGGVQELSSGRLSPEQAERLERLILRESDRLDRTVSQFLEYSRSRPSKQMEPVPVLRCLEEVRELLVQRADAREIAISIEVDGDDAQGAVIRGSQDLFHKLFLNLGINAIEACRGTGELSYRVMVPKSGGVEVTVEDDGPGMDEATMNRAFNPFFTTKTREGGLGLALVKKIVDGHRGSIEVESEKGLGTRFRVWLPGTEHIVPGESAMVTAGART